MKYIYYQIYRFYLRWGDRTPDILATAVITLLEFSHVWSILYLFTYYRNFRLEISRWWILPIGGIYFLNYLYFKRISADEIEKWDTEDPTKRDIKGALIILYIVISIAFPFYLVTKIYNLAHEGI